MLDFSWPEIFVILVVALVVIGPQDIPKIMHGLGRFVRRLQYVRFALSQQFDDFMKEHDLEDIRRAANARPDELFDEAAADEEDMAVEPMKEDRHERQSS
ncbi:MAG: twin-arginine translocase TatA/TatE family subunit [Micavibrio aeruginosavorus]|uniref:Twin-arginine translocase TatA/TatE family subunit n=1 Tax=Micavibrio aeruginosavorus TaxID=349221 RepID=A0A7T5UHJ2_9BACT|nr:MAG: twin-arginine translocase TatA/TatE family subunit [Micavibrio aeruginosavorus]